MSDDGDKKFSSVFFIINDPQLCRDLRLGVNSAVYSDNSDDATAPKPLTEMLYEIIQDGPSYGVHTIIGFDTYNNFNRVFELDALKEFVFRAAGQMGADDSQELLDTTKATKLGRYFAYLFNEDTVSTEKFRPYSLPKLEWLIKIKSSRTS